MTPRRNQPNPAPAHSPQPPAQCGTALLRQVPPLRKGLTDMHCTPILPGFQRRGHSSAGRAPAWHAGGRRFDPAWLHQVLIQCKSFARTRASMCGLFEKSTSPSSRGLGHHPFTVATGVRIPVGTPSWTAQAGSCCNCGVVVQLVRMLACHAGGRGFESRPLRHF